MHGYLTLSLLPRLQHEIYRIDGFEFGLNYGLNRVRFPAPVPVGGRIRLHVALDEVREVPGGVQGVMTATFEISGSERPGCVAEQVFRVYGPEDGSKSRSELVGRWRQGEASRPKVGHIFEKDLGRSAPYGRLVYIYDPGFNGSLQRCR